MCLRNYYNLLTALFYGDMTPSDNAQPANYNPPIRIRNSDGSWRYVENYEAADKSFGTSSAITSYARYKDALFGIGKAPLKYSAANPDVGTSTYSFLSLQLGSGSTPVSYDDYDLAAKISSGFSLSSINGTLVTPSSYDEATHKYSSTRKWTLTNNTAGNITVRELGIYVGDNNDQGSPILIYRDVFDENIILEPSESIDVKFTREGEVFNYTPYT